jgi:cation diffusion facilitator family transporter
MLNSAQKITLIGGINNLFLAIIKIIFGFLGGSAALIADGLHSLSDLLSDFLVFWVAKHSHKAPDDDHPYGHQKFDTLATLGLGVILALIGLGVFYDAIINFNIVASLSYDYFLMAIALISIISKEVMYWLTIKVGKTINSKMLIANAWHHRLDAISSIVVLIGIIGALNGYVYLDKIAAIVIALMIFHIAWELVKDATKELVESAIDKEEVLKIEQAVSKVSGVVALHSLRTRKIGGDIISDMHIQVESRLSVSEAHMIGISVEKVAKNSVNNLTEVMVHIDPEDDENHKPSAKLPSRAEALGIINQRLFESGCECDSDIQDIRLHYLNGKIEIDFYLNIDCLSKTNTKENIQRKLADLFKNLPEFSTIRVFFS